jgi:hypothetical protein
VTLDRTFYSLRLVNGTIRDIGQNVLQSSFEQGAAAATVCSYRIPGGGFFRNVIITLCINHIILFINNNAVINNNLYKILRFYFLFKFPLARERVSSKIKFGHELSKSSAIPAL